MMDDLPTGGKVSAGPVTVQPLARFCCLALCACVISGCSMHGGVAASASQAEPAHGRVTVAEAERLAWAQNARWAPGQLQEHFNKHGGDGPFASISEYDQAARDTVIAGRPFTYVEGESRVERMGFYDAHSNGFTSLTPDGQRILTFFHPDRHELYVRGLDRSTYR